MLNAKIRLPDMCEIIIEAEMFRYEPRRQLPEVSAMAFTPATVLAFGQLGGSQSSVYYSTGTVWVTNDKGRTIATYYLDAENAVTGLAHVE